MTEQARDDYNKLPPDIRRAMRKACNALWHQSDPPGSHRLTGPLSGHAALGLIVQGVHYRAIYTVQGNHIRIWAVGPHENLYGKAIKRMRGGGA